MNHVDKDKKVAFEAGFSYKINQLVELVAVDPFQKYPPYEKLLGDMLGAYSRLINIQIGLYIDTIDISPIL